MGIKVTGGVKVPQGKFSVYTPPPPLTGPQLWSWGGNSPNGQLGLLDADNRSSPTQVGTDINWSVLSAARFHSHAVKADGTLWGWGDGGTGGYLGLGDSLDRSSPTQVGALTDWATVGVGNQVGHAIKTNGELWGWGKGGSGQIGNELTSVQLNPIKIGSDTWSMVSGGSGHTLAIRTDGSLWGWGANSFGQLGLDDTPNRSSPVQIGNDTNWTYVTGSSN